MILAMEVIMMTRDGAFFGGALHYWLRPIEGVQFRFDNFGSHFIRVKICISDIFNLAPHFI